MSDWYCKMFETGKINNAARCKKRETILCEMSKLTVVHKQKDVIASQGHAAFLILYMFTVRWCILSVYHFGSGGTTVAKSDLVFADILLL